MLATSSDRKRLGAWYTPPELVDEVVGAVVATLDRRPVWPRRVRVLDPACGDGRLVTAVAAALAARGTTCELHGCDIDPEAVAAAQAAGLTVERADALARDWGDARFDVIVGNPPFLSQMAAATTRGGASRHGGGPYADAAAEFLALAVRLADPDSGVVAMVLPQSLLGARDAGPVRAAVDGVADLTWSWWQPRQQLFDAQVNVCVLGFALGAGARPQSAGGWTRVVTDRLGIPTLSPGDLATAGTIGDRAHLNANFRDEYYALVDAVEDGGAGPPLVTSGLIDPGVCHWGSRPVRFAKRVFEAPRVDLARLTGRFSDWAARKLVPKVLVANQTRVIEAVADPTGAWLPGVPVSTVAPVGEASVWEVAAVLTCPVASVLAWQAMAGTGLSAATVRLSPAVLAATPWPAGALADAVAALRAGDVAACAESVCDAYALEAPATADLLGWWHAWRPRP